MMKSIKQIIPVILAIIFIASNFGFARQGAVVAVTGKVVDAEKNEPLKAVVEYKSLPNDGTFHRALADAEMTAHLWLNMMSDIKADHSFKMIPFNVMQKLSRTAKNAAAGFLSRESNK
jgi:hypothetical protein